MGGIISIIAIGLLIARGLDYAHVGVLAIGIILFVMRLIWR
jgi:hypothetical protein